MVGYLVGLATVPLDKHLIKMESLPTAFGDYARLNKQKILFDRSKRIEDFVAQQQYQNTKTKEVEPENVIDISKKE